MFPKQRCPMCQNRAWEGTTSGSAMLENKKLKEEIVLLKATLAGLEFKIKELEAKCHA